MANDVAVNIDNSKGHQLGIITTSVLPGGQTTGKQNTDDQDVGLSDDQLFSVYDVRFDDPTYYAA